ncbi:MAG: hypothetical protein GF411_09970 [Candidatus Lokiarchaeota archaeon]|nr:hypothetical protein [Candidatus Lokiarchaeota archaeon]
MSSFSSTLIEFRVGSNLLSGILESKTNEHLFVMFLLHPHPLFGGDMHNEVIREIALHLQHIGVDTFRFNFRGSGDSKSDYAGVDGAVADLRNAVDKVQSVTGISKYSFLGYSFGASIALISTGIMDPNYVIALSPSYSLIQETSNHDDILQNISCPTLLIHGSRDMTVPIKNSIIIAKKIEDSLLTKIILNEGHFYLNKLPHTCEIIKDYITSQKPQ